MIRTNFCLGMSTLGQIRLSSWWEWTDGSVPLFWRWNGQEQISAVRDDMKIFVSSSLPRSHRKTKPPRFDSESLPLVAGKIDSMISKSYLETGRVNTFLHYFAVPKGDSDIRVVFDGTSCGLNECLWSPNFFFPTAKNASELLGFETWMVDVYFGEFFHNFFMDGRIRCHAGVDTTTLSKSLTNRRPQPLKFEGLR